MERLALVLFSLLLCTACYAESYEINEDVQTQNISTHVLDVGNGFPSVNVSVEAFYLENGTFVSIGNTTTDVTGRVPIVHPGLPLQLGIYKLRFNTEQYYTQFSQTTFFPKPELVFVVDDTSVHYHVPLTLSRFGYTTYKGQ
uniref:5-hydroxyisourate hydrolase n=1 Tax=Plectus sambesii TaxID=2011161 RepID=A0A914V7Z0_9BILA